MILLPYDLPSLEAAANEMTCILSQRRRGEERDKYTYKIQKS